MVIALEALGTLGCVNADRADSYTRLTRYLEAVGPSKLHADEQDRVRHAADTLVFADAWDNDVAAALDDINHLAESLVDSGRWEPDSADHLVELVGSCGPEEAQALALS
jgi:hypothetical protein